jgi:hypothetical protein
MSRVANTFWGRFVATIVHDDDFETWPVRLKRQRLQASIKHCPVVVNSDNNTEQRRLIRKLAMLDHASSSALPGGFIEVELHTQG